MIHAYYALQTWPVHWLFLSQHIEKKEVVCLVAHSYTTVPTSGGNVYTLLADKIN